MSEKGVAGTRDRDVGLSFGPAPDGRRVAAVRGSGPCLAAGNLLLVVGTAAETLLGDRIEVYAGGLVIVPVAISPGWQRPRAVLATEIVELVAEKGLGRSSIEIRHAALDVGSPVVVHCGDDHQVIDAVRRMMAGRTPVDVRAMPGCNERVAAVRGSGALLGKPLRDRDVFGARVVEAYPAGLVVCRTFRGKPFNERAILATELGRIRMPGGYWGNKVSLAHAGPEMVSPLVLSVGEEHSMVEAIREMAAVSARPTARIRAAGGTGADAVVGPAVAGHERVGFLPDLGVGEWLFGLPGWMLATGFELAIGESATWAIRVADRGLRRVGTSTRSALALGSAVYELRAKAGFASDELTVLDFGIVGFLGERPNGVSAGEPIAGRAALAIDPIEYAELHQARAGVPHAVRRWTVTGLWRRPPGASAWDQPTTATPLEAEDPRRFGYAAIDRTDLSAADADGRGDYLVRARPEPS